MKEFGQPDSLNLTLAAETGANAGLTKKTATQAVILLGKIAVRTEATTIREMAAGWGREFLQAVGEHPVDLSDQTSRYEALLELTGIDVVADTSRDGGSIAAASVVLPAATSRSARGTPAWSAAPPASAIASAAPRHVAARRAPAAPATSTGSQPGSGRHTSRRWTSRPRSSGTSRAVRHDDPDVLRTARRR
jgi:hypothetical protein